MKRCYFAYTWDDDSLHLPVLLEYLKNEITKYTEGGVQIIYDRNLFRTGDDFEEKEKLILSSDSLVVFFSPQYKQIIDEQDENRGVFREYKMIRKVQEKGVAAIIPIIVEGNEKNAIPIEFRKRIAQPLELNNVVTKGREKKIKNQYKPMIDNLVRKIIKETTLAYKKRDYEFATTEEMIEALFGESEANEKLPQKCMCKTDAYTSVMSQYRRYIIGRKGSGKTTFFELLEKYDVDAYENRYKVLKPIYAEGINMEYIYSVINSHRVDDVLFSVNDRLEMFWKIYIYLSAIYIVCLEEEKFKVEDTARRIVFAEAGEVLRKKKFNVESLETEECHRSLFVSAIDTFDHFFRSQIIDSGRDESFQASLVANYNIDNVLSHYFGKQLYDKIKMAIVQCQKNILIALDRFDTVSDAFRKQTINFLNKNDIVAKKEGEKRLEFEGLFFSSMFNVLESLRKSDKGIMRKVSFCIIVPQDKIDQIKKTDRDFSKYNFASLSWDAIDLLEMLVYRLEYIFSIKREEEAEEGNLQDRFERIMKKYFKAVPLTIQVKTGDKNASMDLFKYMLRLSFWRPRDIIKYFYELYSANKNIIRKGEMLPSETIKSILYKKAEDIIETEFYGEYRNVITNLEDIMQKFKGSNIIIDLNTVCDLLEKQPFQTAALREFSAPMNKFKMLYELGALGIFVERSIQVQENIKSEVCFNYNEGLEPLRLLDNTNYVSKGLVKCVINPIFSRKLSLNYDVNIILEDYEWDYLYENHIRKSSIKRI